MITKWPVKDLEYSEGNFQSIRRHGNCMLCFHARSTGHYQFDTIGDIRTISTNTRDIWMCTGGSQLQ